MTGILVCGRNQRACVHICMGTANIYHVRRKPSPDNMSVAFCTTDRYQVRAVDIHVLPMQESVCALEHYHKPGTAVARYATRRGSNVTCPAFRAQVYHCIYLPGFTSEQSIFRVRFAHDTGTAAVLCTDCCIIVCKPRMRRLILQFILYGSTAVCVYCCSV